MEEIGIKSSGSHCPFFLCSRFRDVSIVPTVFWLLLISPLVASSLVSYVMLLSSCQGHPTTASFQLPIQKAIQSTLRSLEMHYKRRCKIGISSVILGERLSLSKLQGPQCYFIEKFRCTRTFYESENFSDFSLHNIFESGNKRFSFSTKIRQKWERKCEKITEENC